MDWGERLDRDLADSAAEGRRIRDVYTYNTSHGFVMYALCEDGTLWSRSPFAEDGNTGWDAVPPIPGSFQTLVDGIVTKAKAIDDRLHDSYEHPEK